MDENNEDQRHASANIEDQRHTPTNVEEQSSSETIITSESPESILPINTTIDQCVRVCPIKIENVCIQPNPTIKHPNWSNDDPFTEQQRRIIDKHVKVSHVDRSALHRIATEMSLLKITPYARRKSTGTIVVSLPNKRSSANTHQRLSSRQNTVRISRISTAESIKQDLQRQRIPSKMKENVIHVSIKQKNYKKSSS